MFHCYLFFRECMSGKMILGMLHNKATAARYQLMFFKNGSLEDFMGDWAQAQNSSADPTNNFTTQISLTAGDYIDARIYHNGGTTETLQSAYARFYGYRLIGV